MIAAVVILSIALSTVTHAADDLSDLSSICKVAAQNGNEQIKSLCKAMITSYAGSGTNENNSRVWAPVVAVCGNACLQSIVGNSAKSICSNARIQGGLNDSVTNDQMQAGLAELRGSARTVNTNGGDPCSSTVGASQNAYGAHKTSKEDSESARANAKTILAAAAENTTFVAGAIKGPAEKGALDNYPFACKQLILGNLSLQNRLDCASATDDRLPAFVKSPEFAAEFKSVTGSSLESVLDENSSQVVSAIAPTMIKQAYNSVSGKLSLGQFLKTGTQLSKVISDSLPTPEDRNSFMAELLPASLRNFMPSTNTASSASLRGAQLAATKPTNDREPAADTLRPATVASDMLTGQAPERPEDESLSIFEKVSRCYRRVTSRLTDNSGS